MDRFTTAKPMARRLLQALALLLALLLLIACTPTPSETPDDSVGGNQPPQDQDPSDDGEEEQPPKEDAGDKEEQLMREVENYNYMLGTQAFNPNYQFTDESPLMEIAGRIDEWGSNMIKFYATDDHMIDELLDVFEADAMHIGCDEAMMLGECPRCRGTEPHILFANYIKMLCDHLASRGAQAMMWTDRLLHHTESGYNCVYEASANGTDKAIALVPKSLLCCDWHYGKHDSYRSVDIFADHGLRMMICPWKNVENTKRFLNSALEHDRGHIEGYLQTTWCSSGELARYFLYGEEPLWKPQTPLLIQVMKEVFLPL